MTEADAELPEAAREQGISGILTRLIEPFWLGQEIAAANAQAARWEKGEVEAYFQQAERLGALATGLGAAATSAPREELAASFQLACDAVVCSLHAHAAAIGKPRFEPDDWLELSAGEFLRPDREFLDPQWPLVAAALRDRPARALQPGAPELAQQRAALLAFLEALQQPLRKPLVFRRQLYGQRAMRVVGAVVVMALLSVGVTRAARATYRGPNLALGRRARASSRAAWFHDRLAVTDGDRVLLAMHTNRESGPSVVVDLGLPQTVGRVVVYNRVDCCAEQAVPLAVEVSEDGKHYRLVASRRDAFDRWEARFRPRRARFVRLQVRRVSFLHLTEVEVYGR